MKKTFTFAKEFFLGKLSYYSLLHNREYYNSNKYLGNTILSAEKTSELITNAIITNTPFMVARFGANELNAMSVFDFEVSHKYAKTLAIMHNNAGLFPESIETGKAFCNLMIDQIQNIDLIGMWLQPFENYYLNKYGSGSINRTWLRFLEPWSNISLPWTLALKDKKVLIVHPFAESIQSQYKKRETLFVHNEILPSFNLICLKAVQTSGGEVDTRFHSWFDAYQWMREEILKTDFDVAILGCGSYGFPLAAEIKKAGKISIHLGGATQLLFGIMGRRWENEPMIQTLVTPSWIRPSKKEIPINSSSIENSCYW